MLRLCKRLSKQAFALVFTDFSSISDFSGLPCVDDRCRCCLLMSNSTRDARHTSLSMIYPEDLRSKQHRLASPSTPLRACTLGIMSFPQTLDLSATTSVAFTNITLLREKFSLSLLKLTYPFFCFSINGSTLNL